MTKWMLNHENIGVIPGDRMQISLCLYFDPELQIETKMDLHLR
jgi:hypothetical protein